MYKQYLSKIRTRLANREIRNYTHIVDATHDDQRFNTFKIEKINFCMSIYILLNIYTFRVSKDLRMRISIYKILSFVIQRYIASLEIIITDVKFQCKFHWPILGWLACIYIPFKLACAINYLPLRSKIAINIYACTSILNVNHIPNVGLIDEVVGKFEEI